MNASTSARHFLIEHLRAPTLYSVFEFDARRRAIVRTIPEIDSNKECNPDKFQPNSCHQFGGTLSGQCTVEPHSRTIFNAIGPLSLTLRGAHSTLFVCGGESSQRQRVLAGDQDIAFM